MIFTKSLSFQIRCLKLKGKNHIKLIGSYSERIFKHEKTDPQAGLLIEKIKFSLLSKNKWK